MTFPPIAHDDYRRPFYEGFDPDAYETFRGIHTERVETKARPQPTNAGERSANALRPQTLDLVIGQDRLKRFMRRVIDAALRMGVPLDHVLLVGPSGVGKSTFANVIANELHVACYQVEAPVSHDTLLALREVMRDGDILFIDEAHQQAVMQRRGKDSSTQPEVLFNVMEDRTIVTDSGVLAFPAITVIAATTDEGGLPDPFINRFPLRPPFDHYEVPELATIAVLNGEALGVLVEDDAAIMFARASRGVPRQINNYVRNAASLTQYGVVNADLADEVLSDLNRVTEDGLTADMQQTLTFLYRRCKHTTAKGDVTYRASVNTIATAIGKSRDSKAVMLRVEPFLIEKGYLQVGSGGRILTDDGITRAQELLTP